MNTLSITKHKARICLGVFLAVILVACSKDNNTVSQKETLAEEQTSANNTAARSSGAIQVSGMGFFAEAGECPAVKRGRSKPKGKSKAEAHPAPTATADDAAIPQFCDFICPHAEFPPAETAGICRTMSASSPLRDMNE